MNTERTNTGMGFWLAWVLASIMGFGVGALLGINLAYGLIDGDVFITLGIIMGATGGYFQWVVLRDRIAGAGLWGLASALGFGLTMGAIVAADAVEIDAMTAVLIASVFGVGGGTPQWLILRRKVPRAGWWLLANLLGSLIGAIALPIASAILEAGKWDLGFMTFGVVFGAGNGAITGAALVWLLRQSPSRNVEGLATAH